MTVAALIALIDAGVALEPSVAALIGILANMIAEGRKEASAAEVATLQAAMDEGAAVDAQVNAALAPPASK